jgi:hypothetical protein
MNIEYYIAELEGEIDEQLRLYIDEGYHEGILQDAIEKMLSDKDIIEVAYRKNLSVEELTDALFQTYLS